MVAIKTKYDLNSNSLNNTLYSWEAPFRSEVYESSVKLAVKLCIAKCIATREGIGSVGDACVGKTSPSLLLPPPLPP